MIPQKKKKKKKRDQKRWMYPCRREEEELQEIKRRKKDPMLHMEDEAYVEDIYDTRGDEQAYVPTKPVKKQVKRLGPTSRSHF
jgi:hypothetical protein